MNKKIAMAMTAALVSCGGSWTDPTSGSFSAQDSAEVMGMISEALDAAMAIQAPQPRLRNALTESISVTRSCAAGGTVTVAGSMDSDCTETSTSCSFNGELSLALDSCATQNGMVGQGGLGIWANGSMSNSGADVALNERIQGGITVTRNGSVIGTCGINLTVSITSTSSSSSVSVSGTVCRQAMSQ
jgi:hypothetical protein